MALAARRLDRLDSLVDELKVEGAEGVCAVRMDVRDESSIKAGVKQASPAAKGRRSRSLPTLFDLTKGARGMLLCESSTAQGKVFEE